MSRGVLTPIINNMCGIVYTERKDGGQVCNTLIKRYKHQIHRGTDGFAFLAIAENYVTNLVRRRTDREIMKDLREETASRILFHHRFPTSTANIPSATHPIVVENDMLDHNYYVVHNGVLQNEDVLRKDHEKKGFVYNTIVKNAMTHRGVDGELYFGEEKETFNDSEALAIDLALYLDGKSTKLESAGSIAFICIQTDKDDKVLNLYFGRNDGNPLVVEDRGDLFCIKSEGTGYSIDADTLYYYSFADVERTIMSTPLMIGTYVGRKKVTPSSWSRHGYGTAYDDDGRDVYAVRANEFYKTHKWDQANMCYVEIEPKRLPIGFHSQDAEDDDMTITYDDIPTVDDYVLSLYEELYEVEDGIKVLAREMFDNDQDEKSNETNEGLMADRQARKKELEDMILEAESNTDDRQVKKIFS